MGPSGYPGKGETSIVAAAINHARGDLEAIPYRMRTSIVIAHFNGKHLLDTCLSSLLPQVESPGSVIVVDNGSSDGSQEHIRMQWPMVTGLFLERNTGFTGANNAGSALTDSEFIVLLNNDTRVAGNWLSNLLRPFSDPAVGAVTSSMRRMGEPGTMDSAGASMDTLGYGFDRGRGQPAEDWAQPDELIAPCGGAMALRRSAVEDRRTVFWNDLFLYLEDIELGIRLWRNGFRVVYEPEAVVEHAMSATAGRNSPMKDLYCTRNRILILRRHLGREFSRIALPLVTWEVMLLVFMLAKGRVERFRSTLQGLRKAFTMPVAPLGDPATARSILARFMQPTTGTPVRRRLGSMVYSRIQP